jgi:hypothetical protein
MWSANGRSVTHSDIPMDVTELNHTQYKYRMCGYQEDAQNVVLLLT